MIFDFLKPIANNFVIEKNEENSSKIGANIILHLDDETPNLDVVKVAIIGLTNNNVDSEIDLNKFREQFYNLHQGNWYKEFADLGDLVLGVDSEDNFFALKEILTELHKKNIVSILIGGPQSMTYAMYRGYNQDLMLNMVNIDSEFDINPVEHFGIEAGYVSRMILENPINLNNYTVLGYQTYFNNHQSIDLMDKLYFEAVKLGDVCADLKLSEPYLRDADIVTVDLGAIESSYLGFNHHNPNGFSGKDICTLTRYAGISDRVTSFGVFNGFGGSVESMLLAQMIWYFVEGVNLRSNEYPISNRNNFTKYIVPVDNDQIVFYKSNQTERWWLEIELNKKLNNKHKNSTLLPCSQQDYINACEQEIPDRWWKAYRRNL